MSSLLIRGELLLLNLECGEKNKTQLTDTFRDELVKNQVHSQEVEENKLPQVDQVSAGQREIYRGIFVDILFDFLLHLLDQQHPYCHQCKLFMAFVVLSCLCPVFSSGICPAVSRPNPFLFQTSPAFKILLTLFLI